MSVVWREGGRLRRANGTPCYLTPDHSYFPFPLTTDH